MDCQEWHPICPWQGWIIGCCAASPTSKRPLLSALAAFSTISFAEEKNGWYREAFKLCCYDLNGRKWQGNWLDLIYPYFFWCHSRFKTSASSFPLMVAVLSRIDTISRWLIFTGPGIRKKWEAPNGQRGTFCALSYQSLLFDGSRKLHGLSALSKMPGSRWLCLPYVCKISSYEKKSFN